MALSPRAEQLSLPDAAAAGHGTTPRGRGSIPRRRGNPSAPAEHSS
ncbi:hypothetical protein [Streptomyces zhihengii]